MSARLAGYWRASFWRDYRVTILVLLALAIGWLTLRTSPTPVPMDADLAEIVATGQPLVLEFYSNT